MSKKIRRIAVLSLCVVMFAAVQPACARTWGEFFGETIGGGVVGGLLGVAAVALTGGAALPIIAGSAAVGAAVGATPEEDRTTLVTGTAAGVGAAVIVKELKSVHLSVTS